MLRYQSPYYGMRYLADKSTMIIHDLEDESSMCNINDIDEENIIMLDSEEDVSELIDSEDFNGCYWCNKQFYNESILD